MLDTQPSDYHDAFAAAIGSWWYFLTFLLPGMVYVLPAIKRWRYILWLIPVAFIASCIGYFIYWRSIDWALMAYYHKTGYFNTADTWYAFMPIFRGIPNALVATIACTMIGWLVSRRGLYETQIDTQTIAYDAPLADHIGSQNPYEPPRTPSQNGG